MKQVKLLNPAVPVFWDRNADTDIARDIEIAMREGFKSIVVHQDGITDILVKTVRAAGLEVGSWTINDIDRIQSFLGMGVQRIYTDHPAALLRLIGTY